MAVHWQAVLSPTVLGAGAMAGGLGSSDSIRDLSGPLVSGTGCIITFPESATAKL